MNGYFWLLEKERERFTRTRICVVTVYGQWCVVFELTGNDDTVKPWRPMRNRGPWTADLGDWESALAVAGERTNELVSEGWVCFNETPIAWECAEVPDSSVEGAFLYEQLWNEWAYTNDPLMASS